MEEDIQVFNQEKPGSKFLILVPNHVIEEDWWARINKSLTNLRGKISVFIYAYMERHYSEYAQEYFQYVVVDEAHHAVAPGLKRTIQYFQPNFLVG